MENENQALKRFVLVMSEEVESVAEGLEIELTRNQINDIVEIVINDSHLWQRFNEGISAIIDEYLKGKEG